MCFPCQEVHSSLTRGRNAGDKGDYAGELWACKVCRITLLGVARNVQWVKVNFILPWAFKYNLSTIIMYESIIYCNFGWFTRVFTWMMILCNRYTWISSFLCGCMKWKIENAFLIWKCGNRSKIYAQPDRDCLCDVE